MVFVCFVVGILIATFATYFLAAIFMYLFSKNIHRKEEEINKEATSIIKEMLSFERKLVYDHDLFMGKNTTDVINPASATVYMAAMDTLSAERSWCGSGRDCKSFNSTRYSSDLGSDFGLDFDGSDCCD